MRVLFLACIIALIFCRCYGPRYVLADTSTIESYNAENSPSNFIHLTKKDLTNSVILNNAYLQIGKNKKNKLEKTLDSLGNQMNLTMYSDYYLAKAFLHISKRHYKRASEDLVLVVDSNYTLIKKLMIVDLKYALEKRSNDAVFKNTLLNYQKLCDEFPNDEILKKIVKMRIRYIRYNTIY